MNHLKKISKCLSLSILLVMFLFTSCKKEIAVPSVSTVSLSNISQTTANSGGSITSDGGAAVTERGVCWGPSATPTITDNKTSDGAGIGNFTSNISGLIVNTAYYVRAYATNSSGTGYGTAILFTTNPVSCPILTTGTVTEISQISVNCGGTITMDGGANVTIRGVCWSILATPTIADRNTTNGAGIGTFSSSVSGLKANTTYYLRAYATNSACTGYGQPVSFTTSPILIPTVTTAAINSITRNTATGGGNVTSDGGGTITKRGVCWSTSPNPSAENSKSTDGTGVGTFASSITPLFANTLYYVRAYAINEADTAYGEEISFKTYPVAVTLNTTLVTSLKRTSAISGGTITDDGGAVITSRGVCWSTSPGPTVADNLTNNGTGSGTFTSKLEPLASSTKYYVKAYAINSPLPSYGNEIVFTTPKCDEYITDTRDGQQYCYKTIGSLTWTTENLAYLPSVSPSNSFSETAIHYYVYNYEGTSVSEAKMLSNFKTYGTLYNAPASKSACPSGWHLPSDAEWTIIKEYLGSSAGGEMKETGTSHWDSPNSGATNSSGFSALPGGCLRSSDFSGYFDKLRRVAEFWSSTEYRADYGYMVWDCSLNYDNTNVDHQIKFKKDGYSVRCIKNY